MGAGLGGLARSWDDKWSERGVEIGRSVLEFTYKQRICKIKPHFCIMIVLLRFDCHLISPCCTQARF